MSTRIQIKVIPEKKDDFIYHKKLVSIELGCNPDEIYSINLLKRSIDARKRVIKYVLSYEVFFESVNTSETLSQTSYSDVSKAKNTVYIVGCGPAGLFAALSCLQHGFKPVVFERGKDVRSRRRDIALLNKKGTVNVESNYCFGEGGAGTYSDGKLYTRSKKRGSVKKILDLLVKHGANNDITIDAHPHIGTNKLPTIIQDITQTIIHFGGEVNFDSKLTNINVVGNKLNSINPVTGQPEFFFKKVFKTLKRTAKRVAKVAKAVAPIALAVAAPFMIPLLPAAVSVGIGSLAGNLIAGRSFKDSLKAAVIAGGIAGVGNMAFREGSFFGSPANPTPAPPEKPIRPPSAMASGSMSSGRSFNLSPRSFSFFFLSLSTASLFCLFILSNISASVSVLLEKS